MTDKETKEHASILDSLKAQHPDKTFADDCRYTKLPPVDKDSPAPERKPIFPVSKEVSERRSRRGRQIVERLRETWTPCSRCGHRMDPSWSSKRERGDLCGPCHKSWLKE